jgi:hypothetical protein
MIFFKKSVICLDAFTTNSGIHELFPIKPAVKFVPEWWKNIPKTYPERDEYGILTENATMKTCVGFLDLYKTGFIMPNWSDTIFRTYSDGQWAYKQAAEDLPQISSHNPKQFGDLQNLLHAKIESPWIITEKTGVKFLFTDPKWNKLKTINDFIVLDGIVDFKYQHSTNINIFMHQKNNQIQLDAGDPLVHIIPLSDKRIKIKNHLVSQSEYLNIKNKSSYCSKFSKKYSFNKNIKDSKQKCPFGFG